MLSLNPDHIEALSALINKAPYFQLLSMKIIDIDFGRSRVEVELENKHLNPFGGLHGGVYSSIIDTAAYWACYCDLSEEVGLISIDLTVNNLSTLKDGKLIIEGKRLKTGRSICLAEAVVTDTQGKLLAQGISKQMVLEGLQSIKQAVAAMGHAPLPVKFLQAPLKI